jgi:hypothetical protein
MSRPYPCGNCKRAFALGPFLSVYLPLCHRSTRIWAWQQWNHQRMADVPEHQGMWIKLEVSWTTSCHIFRGVLRESWRNCSLTPCEQREMPEGCWVCPPGCHYHQLPLRQYYCCLLHHGFLDFAQIWKKRVERLRKCLVCFTTQWGTNISHVTHVEHKLTWCVLGVGVLCTPVQQLFVKLKMARPNQQKHFLCTVELEKCVIISKWIKWLENALVIFKSYDKYVPFCGIRSCTLFEFFKCKYNKI